METPYAWAASIKAAIEKPGHSMIFAHSVVLISEHHGFCSEREAYNHALQIAKKRWPRREGWSHHDAIVSRLDEEPDPPEDDEDTPPGVFRDFFADR